MAVTMNDVRRVLDPEEPNYGAVPALGAGALPHLEALVTGPDPMLASKAAYAASLLDGSTGESVVQLAAESSDATVRVAAAAAVRNLPQDSANRMLDTLRSDDDPGIRKVARRSAEEGPVA
jgi:hypothetical protein